MHTLYILSLGVVLGIGLAKLPSSIRQIMERRRLLKALDFDRKIDQALGLLDPETHGYCYAWCHDSQAEHDADLPDRCICDDRSLSFFERTNCTAPGRKETTIYFTGTEALQGKLHPAKVRETMREKVSSTTEEDYW